jgi:hypothetical protein
MAGGGAGGAVAGDRVGGGEWLRDPRPEESIDGRWARALPPGLYLRAGIHGDEAGAVLGLLEWAEGNLDVLRTHPVVIFPIVNPWGVAHNKREDESGRDLNRAFDEFSIEPIGAMLDFIAGVEFAVAVSLHEDYDANGVYLYELARRGERWGDELLQRVEGVLPRLEGATVEGRRAVNGVLRRTQGLKKIAREIDGMPESIALYLSHARTALTFETPSEFSISRRVKAHMRFLDGVVARVIRSGE